ncbi:hypothetical protein BBP00_00007035 [Phytophthora kernoviae]|uniref:Uncharacterized protein n=1 Tax=Phytophthora kernoviae TaxID=325452 RepID=A0A3F2RLE1_9STRA|nr:hypothetical protein BBP00_00007035 [Phytophthora kernoviae]
MQQAPSHTISGREKFGSAADLENSAKTPGPGNYNTDVINPRERAAPSYSLGKKWAQTDGDKKIPGPGAYDASSTIGHTVESLYRTAPKVSMGGRTKFGSMDTMGAPGSPTGHGGYTDPKSAIGGQIDSRKNTAPSATFGSGVRARPTTGAKSPGPGSYKIPSSMGQAPSHTISGREKFGSAADLENSAKTPGPGNYNTDVINPRERAAPSYSLGKKWAQTDGDKKIPGPGAYDASSTIGHTVLSTHKSNTGASFSKVERKPLHTSGTADVGPGQYSVVVEAVGRQTVSTVNSGASYSFGTESRTKNDRSVVDGPRSHYYDPKSSVGKQVESLYPTAPKATMAGRTKFSSHL